jgi:hypothetical protein
MWMTGIGASVWTQDGVYTSNWGVTLAMTGLTASMVVNAMVTGLIVFKIFKVFHVAKDNTTSEEKSLGVTGGRKLRSAIFIIIESGMTLFAIQLARIVLATLEPSTNAENDAYALIAVIHQMLNVIISSVIVYFTDNVDFARA